MLDLRPEAAAETAEKIIASDGRAAPIEADVAVAADAEAAVRRTVSAFGRLDVVYNNAGVDSTGSVAEATEEDWDRCFAVNVKGTFLVSRAAVPQLAAADGGVIVNQASVAGLIGARSRTIGTL